MNDLFRAANSKTATNDGASAARAPVMSVSLLVSSARLVIERQLGLVWVGGEISGLTRPASGHVYFTLKDANAQVRCVFFRTKAFNLPFALRDGLAVEVRAVPSIYDARGEFQLNVETMRLAGIGALYERFLALKARLDAAGLFAQERKRRLPAFARRIGIVTSTRAAALRDVLVTLARRWPSARVIVYPAAVQGSSAVAEIAAAVRLASARAEVDVLIVCRGGGSLEDLWAYNEELVARAIFDCRLPVVSGVGHETDFTICDFVADVRAATPTGAAALVVPDRAIVQASLVEVARRLKRAEAHSLARTAQRLDAAARRLVHPAARLRAQRAELSMLANRLARASRLLLARERQSLGAAKRRFERELRTPPWQAARVLQARNAWRRLSVGRLRALDTRLEGLAQNLAHLNPHAVLTRGYAIVTRDDGRIVYDSSEVTIGDDVSLTLARGSARARVTKTGR
jgi:exodeoxyribonuclease VII large subunit